jgi:hypothetical protein
MSAYSSPRCVAHIRPEILRPGYRLPLECSPLVRFERTAVCLSLPLLEDRLTDGLYHILFNARLGLSRCHVFAQYAKHAISDAVTSFWSMAAAVDRGFLIRTRNFLANRGSAAENGVRVFFILKLQSTVIARCSPSSYTEVPISPRPVRESSFRTVRAIWRYGNKGRCRSSRGAEECPRRESADDWSIEQQSQLQIAWPLPGRRPERGCGCHRRKKSLEPTSFEDFRRQFGLESGIVWPDGGAEAGSDCV